MRLYALWALMGLSGCVGNYLAPTQHAIDANSPTSGASIPSTGCNDGDFARQLWAPVLSTNCYGCHIEGGMAQQHQARFVLTAPTQPDYVAKNLAAVRSMAAIQVNGEPLLWLKPTGQVAHGGGVVLPMGSDDEKALLSFARTDDPILDCHPTLGTGVAKQLLLQSNTQTARQAALTLVGHLPTAQELSLAQNGNLAGAVDRMVADANFDDLVHRVYNDLFLTDGAAGDNGPSLRWCASYGGNIWYTNDLEHNVVVSWGMTQNAPQLVSYVIRNDRPFTEILTANYVLANPLGACALLGPDHNVPYSTACSVDGKTAINQCTTDSMSFGVTDACREFLPVVPKVNHVCGVLSDTTLLTMVPTTLSNRNRHRAAFLMQKFLDLDPLSLGAQLPPGSGTASDPNNPPTLTNPQCVMCHQLVDGIGSSLRNWDATPVFAPVSQPNDVFPPALFGRAMPADDTEEPLCWLGKEMAADPGFARATVKTWFTALTGQQPLDDPPASDPNYLLRLAMKLEQNAFFTQMADQFAADRFNLRHLIGALVASPYFRATGISPGAARDEALQASMFGHAQRRGPEQLNRVIKSLAGGLWRARTGGGTPDQVAATTYLLNDFLISYGGIDSQSTTQRNTDMSSVMAAIANLMALQVPCQRTAADFALPAASRALFPYVELNTLPDGGAGTAKIKQNIQYLYAQILGEDVAMADAEMNEAFALFTTVYNNHANDASLDASCQSGSITSDATHTLHAWMAVESSLFADMEFLYE